MLQRYSTPNVLLYDILLELFQLTDKKTIFDIYWIYIHVCFILPRSWWKSSAWYLA